jgi:uncharacterized membrane protein YeaQ/YmgE (transglycosylase-associated protein family)
MSGAEWTQVVHQWVTDGLVWTGFGTLVGLAAKAIMPGRDPGGALVTLLLGITGSVIGLATLAWFWDGRHVTPVSVPGFVVATLGALLLLLFYRLLAGHLFREGGDGHPATASRHSGRRRVTVVSDE